MQVFENRVAVITGAASGIGTALARLCVSQGMSVVLADVDQQGLEQLASELGASVLVVNTDVSNPESVEALAEQAYQHFGQVNLLFNNAGVLLGGFSWERSLADWQWLLNINLMGVLHGIHSFVPRMLAQGSEAHIVNTSSLAGLLASPLMGPYTVSKQAVIALTETLHYELQSLAANIHVSVLCPGPVATGIAGSGEGHQNDSAISNEASEQLMIGLEAGIASGMSADDCARCVFDAIRDQRFWIFTHEDFKETYQRRVDSVMDNTNPVYQQYTVGD